VSTEPPVVKVLQEAGANADIQAPDNTEETSDSSKQKGGDSSAGESFGYSSDGGSSSEDSTEEQILAQVSEEEVLSQMEKGSVKSLELSPVGEKVEGVLNQGIEESTHSGPDSGVDLNPDVNLEAKKDSSSSESSLSEDSSSEDSSSEDSSDDEAKEMVNKRSNKSLASSDNAKKLKMRLGAISDDSSSSEDQDEGNSGLKDNHEPSEEEPEESEDDDDEESIERSALERSLLGAEKRLLKALEDAATSRMIEELSSLSVIGITLEALKTTSVARLVGSLRKHSSAAVATLAKDLVLKWKALANAPNPAVSLGADQKRQAPSTPNRPRKKRF